MPEKVTRSPPASSPTGPRRRNNSTDLVPSPPAISGPRPVPPADAVTFAPAASALEIIKIYPYTAQGAKQCHADLKLAPGGYSCTTILVMIPAGNANTFPAGIGSAERDSRHRARPEPSGGPSCPGPEASDPRVDGPMGRGSTPS